MAIDEQYLMSMERRIADLERQSRSSVSSVIRSDREPQGRYEPGQYWYDQRNSALKIWDGNRFSERVYCWGFKNDEAQGFQNLVTFTTNDSGMSATNGQITITKNGLYLLNGGADVKSVVGSTTNAYIDVNGTVVAQDYQIQYYSSGVDRLTKKIVFVKPLVKGDIVKLYADGGPIALTTNTFLQVVEL